MQNMPWEPCPRCGGSSVEVTSSGEKRAGWVIVVLTVVGLTAFMLWIKSILGFEANPLDAIIIGLLAALAFPFIGAISGTIGVVVGVVGKVVYYGKCRDCSYQWEIKQSKEAEPSPAPSDTTQAH